MIGTGETHEWGSDEVRNGQELVITRVFDAPQDLVFKAWTESERVARWFGPRGFTTTLFEGDPRVGGTWRARTRSPEGKEHRQHGVVREIRAPEKLVFTSIRDDRPDRETRVTVMLAERDGQTGMAFRQRPFDSLDEREGHREGWTQSFDRLDDYLAGQANQARDQR